MTLPMVFENLNPTKHITVETSNSKYTLGDPGTKPCLIVIAF